MNNFGYKLRCLSGLLKGLHQTFALVAVSTATQQSQGNPTSISKAGSEIVLSPAARAVHRHLCISNKVGVSCNCRKGMWNTALLMLILYPCSLPLGSFRLVLLGRRWSKVHYFCFHNTNYDWGNLEPLTKRTEAMGGTSLFRG